MTYRLARFSRSISILFTGVAFASLLLPAELSGQRESALIQETFSNVDLKLALDLLEENYDIKIAYEHDAVRGIKVTTRLQTASVQDAFQQLLRNTHLEFQLVGPRRVLIRARPSELLSEEPPPAEPYPRKIQLTGSIRDALNAEPLAYANIYCQNGQGATTDNTGAFQLTLDPGSFPLHLQVSYIGYADRRISLDTAGNRELHIELIPKIEELAGIDVFEEKPIIAQMSYQDATEVSVPRLYTLPSFLGGKDVFRDLQLLPGISAHDDLSANFSVRGSQESENMIVLDGITLYHVDHYFGIFSAINPAIADKVTIYKNAFPAEHGGRTSSVIDIQSKTPDLLKLNGHFDFNLLTTSAFLEIPLGGKAGLLLGGRTTNANIAKGSLFDALEQDSRVGGPQDNRLLEATRNQLTAIEPDFYFNDVNAKLFWQMGPQTTATASIFNGYDDFNYDLSNNINIPLRRGAVESAAKYGERAKWINRGFNLELSHEWSPVFSSRLRGGYSTYQNNSRLNYTYDFSSPLKNDSIRVNSLTDNAIQGGDVNLKNTWQIGKKHAFDFGFQFTQNDVRFQFELNDRDILRGDQYARQNALYAQYRGQSFDDRLHLQIGFRQNFYSRTQDTYFSPRLSASFQLTDRWLIKGAWSKYYQFLRESTHETALGRTTNFWVLANEQLIPVSSSANAMLGIRYAHPDFDLDIECYDRRLDGVLEHAQIFTGFAAADGKPPRRNFTFFVGEGRTRGVDVLLKKTTGRYTGWMAYTLSKSTNSFPQIDRGAPFPAQNDRRHQLDIIQQYQWKKWNFALTYIFTSGRPYTDLSLLSQDAIDRRQITARERISYLEDYHRIDVSANYQFPLWNGEAELGASIFNLLDRENVKYRQYIYSLKDEGAAMQRPINTVLGAELQMLRFTPNVHLSWRF